MRMRTSALCISCLWLTVPPTVLAQAIKAPADKAPSALAAPQIKQGRIFSPIGALPVLIGADVKAGAYADYAVSDGGQAATMRWSLLQREGERIALEVAIAPGAAIKSPSVARLRARSDPKSGFALEEIVVQPAGAKPQLMPLDWSQARGGLRAPDPTAFVAKERITVGQASIETDRYRMKAPAGMVDIWLSDAAPPIGVARLAFTPSVSASKGRVLTVSLISMGEGAKPRIVAPPEPYGRRAQEAAAVTGGKQ